LKSAKDVVDENVEDVVPPPVEVMIVSGTRRGQLRSARKGLRVDQVVMWALAGVRQEITIEKLAADLEELVQLRDVLGEEHGEAVARRLSVVRRLTYLVPEV
jgi:hypothetical protein